MFCKFFIFFVYMKIICQNPSKNFHCKTQITVKKNSNLSSLTDIVSNINYQIFQQLKQSCWNHPPTSYTTVLLNVTFLKNMTDALRTVFHILPIFYPSSISKETTNFINIYYTSDLQRINSELIKQKKQPSLSSKVQTIPYFQSIQQITFFIVIILKIYLCSYCCVLSSSSDV